jgi:hypothetical protein
MPTDTLVSGTSWTAPAGVFQVTVQAWGGGAAGGGNSTSADGGGGGGGGAYATIIDPVVPGTSYSYSLGAAGTAVSGATGNAGGDTTWRTTVVVAKGGTGGANPVGGAAGVGGNGGQAASCTPTTGALNGGYGENGIDASNGRGGFGGSSAGTATAGHLTSGASKTYSTAIYPTASTPAASTAPSAGTATTAPATAPASVAADQCIVGVSWNNFQQPRWAAKDRPSMQKVVTDGGGLFLDFDANLSNTQQLTDVQTLINQGADVIVLLAQDDKAGSVLDELRSIRSVNLESPKVAYPVVAIPARYALERRRWTEAAQLQAPDWLKLDRFPWAEAMVCFTRGVGGARSGQPAAAQAELEKIRAIHHALIENKQLDWALPTDILERELAAWIAAAEGKHAEAVRLMTGAADLEDSSEKLPLTPGPIVPAREQLGELFLAANEPSSALREFETSLRSVPNRFNGLYGAAKAAQATHDTGKARTYFAKLVEVCSHAEGGRAELAEAKAFLNTKE